MISKLYFSVDIETYTIDFMTYGHVLERTCCFRLFFFFFIVLANLKLTEIHFPLIPKLRLKPCVTMLSTRMILY